jgi:hypothetical protein
MRMVFVGTLCTEYMRLTKARDWVTGLRHWTEAGDEELSSGESKPFHLGVKLLLAIKSAFDSMAAAALHVDLSKDLKGMTTSTLGMFPG